MEHPGERRGAKAGADAADQQNRVALVLEKLGRHMALAFDEADHPDRWRRVDGAGWAFIVKADVPASHGRAERAAAFGEALDAFAELPKILRLVRVAEV